MVAEDWVGMMNMVGRCGALHSGVMIWNDGPRVVSQHEGIAERRYQHWRLPLVGSRPILTPGALLENLPLGLHPAHRLADHLCTRDERHFLFDMVTVDRDSLRTQMQLCRDLLGGLAMAEQLKDLKLTITQFFQR